MKEWIKASGIRALKTVAQTMVSLLSVGYVGILEIDWVGVLSASALAGLLSILTSIAGLPEVDYAYEDADDEIGELLMVDEEEEGLIELEEMMKSEGYIGEDFSDEQ